MEAMVAMEAMFPFLWLKHLIISSIRVSKKLTREDSANHRLHHPHHPHRPMYRDKVAET